MSVLPSYSSSCWRHGDVTGDRTGLSPHLPPTYQAGPDLHEIKVIQPTRPGDTVNFWPGVLLTQTGEVWGRLVIPQPISFKSELGKSSWFSSDQLRSHIKWTQYWGLTLRFAMVRREERIIMLSDSHWKLSPSLLGLFSWSTYTGILLLVIIKTVVTWSK